MKIVKKIKEKKGEGLVYTVIFILIFIMIFCLISEFIRLFIISQGVRDAIQNAVITTINDNYDDVYHSAREGYTGGYMPSGEEFAESIDFSNVGGYIDELLGTVEESGSHIKYVGKGVKEFGISNLQVNIKNIPIQSSNEERFEADVRVMLEVPVKFGNEILPEMKINLKLKAGYIAKF